MFCIGDEVKTNDCKVKGEITKLITSNVCDHQTGFAHVVQEDGLTFSCPLHTLVKTKIFKRG